MTGAIIFGYAADCTAVEPDLEPYAEVRQLVRLGKQRGSYLTQRVELHYNSIQHHNEMNPAIEALGVALTAVFAAETKNFCLVKQFFT